MQLGELPCRHRLTRTGSMAFDRRAPVRLRLAARCRGVAASTPRPRRGDPGSSPGGSKRGIGVTATHGPSKALIPVRSGDAAWAYCRQGFLRGRMRALRLQRSIGPAARSSPSDARLMVSLRTGSDRASSRPSEPSHAGIGQWQAASTPSRRSRFDSAFPHGRTVGGRSFERKTGVRVPSALRGSWRSGSASAFAPAALRRPPAMRVL